VILLERHIIGASERGGELFLGVCDIPAEGFFGEFESTSSSNSNSESVWAWQSRPGEREIGRTGGARGGLRMRCSRLLKSLFRRVFGGCRILPGGRLGGRGFSVVNRLVMFSVSFQSGGKVRGRVGINQ